MKNSILIFDSGVGGLSILREVRERFPHTHLHYLMDTEWFPYGTREDEALSQRIVSLCDSAVVQLEPSLLILACNTASTLALQPLRDILNIPVVGVVPAIKVAAEQCQKNEEGALQPQIGLLATPATVRRPYTEQLIRDFAPHCTVNCLGSSRLVELSEEFISGRNVIPALQQELSDWLAAHPQMQHVVLGCTHFPLLTPLLSELWPQIHWIDSGKAVAQQAQRIFSGNPAEGDSTTSLWWTGTQRPDGAAEYLRRLGPIHTSNPLIPA